MRPQRLELDGFTAFREPVTVDFADAELFALVGPTGAGKSSIIDALCFALYGSVPRLDRRSVAPVISAGALQARVRLDFTVGERAFSATRVVRRTAGGGATTREARLESAGEVLAGNADEVTRAVEDVLGIGFEQFTTCVVLPQGEFARFLHDTPRDRQELLVRLLELGLYADMRAAAGQRRAAAEASAELTARHVEALAGATPEALDGAAGRVTELEALLAAVEQAEPQLRSLADEAAAARSAAAAARAAAERVAGVAVPRDLTGIAEAVAGAERALTSAQAAARAADEAVQSAEADLAALPPAAELAELARLHTEATQLRGRIANGESYLAEARAQEQAAARAQEQADAAQRAAAAARDHARTRHAAHALAADLAVGQPCPVCEQPVAALPGRDRPPALGDADAALARATARAGEAASACTAAVTARVRAEELLEDCSARLGEAESALAALAAGPTGRAPRAPLDAGDAEAVTAAQRDRGVREEQLAAARRAERDARRAVEEAAGTSERLGARRDGAWAHFDTARDALADLSGLPAVVREDLLASWQALASWARAQAPRRREEEAAATAAAAAADAAGAQLDAQLRARCADAGLTPPTGAPLRDACADALADARSTRERLAEDLRRRTELDAELERQRTDAQVAAALGGHLRANRFEQWLLDEALTQLTIGAGEVLLQLSGGQYSLAVDTHRGFAVVDHRNADEHRSARTLSGGETFLASLALALTLAAHLTALSTVSTPKLESIFLDEGFGSLDPATLDVVAAALEELGAGGRTVGLVTHVRELGERMPVRFEVSRGPGGASVERRAV